MSLDQLKLVLTPPDSPENPGDAIGWSELENALGVALPQDYKAFISTYGTGGVDGFIWILTPFETDENVNFMARTTVMREAYLESKQQFPEYYQHDFYPDKGGILPWGYTDNGDELYWKTNEDTGMWTIIIYESRSSDYHEYPMSLTTFLYEILSGNLVCDAFPEDFPSEGLNSYV